MLWRCLPIVRTLGGYGNTRTIKQASHSIDTYKYTRNLSKNSTASQGNQGQLTRVDGGLTSAHDQLSSHLDASNVNNVPSLHLASSDNSAKPMSNVQPSDRNSTSTSTPIDILRTILLCRVTESPSHKPYNSDMLISLITSVQTEGQLSKLSPGDISAIISLLGTLSIYPATTYLYDHPLASRLTIKSPRTYWTCITQIAEEKVRLGLGLTPSDHYWLMRVELAGVTHADSEQPSDSNPLNNHDAMLRACQHYRFIRRHSIDPEVHGPYFEALCSLRTAMHLKVAVKSLCELLSWSYTLHHPRLLAVLWRIVLTPAVELCPKSKEAILTTLVGRLHRHARSLSQTRSGASKSSAIVEISALLNSSDDPIQDDYGIASLVHAFRATIFSAPLPSWKDESNTFANESYKWALSQALAAFTPQRSLADRWNSFVLLAHSGLAPASNNTPASTIPQSNGNDNKNILGWDVICVLATLQKSFNNTGLAPSLDRSLEQDIQGIGGTLWTTWLRDFRANAKPRFVAQAVAASFFRIAAITKDVFLVNAVTSHCASSKLWSIEVNTRSEALQVASLASEYIGASLMCRTSSLEYILVELHSSFRSSLWPSVIQGIIANFSYRDVQIASKLYILAKQIADFPIDTSRSLAVLLASRGCIDVALHLLRNHRFSQSQTEILVDSVILSLTKHRNTILHPDIANVLGRVMYNLYTVSPPSPKYRPVIQYILLVLGSSKYSARAGTIFRAIHVTSPSFFSKAFILRLLRLLIRHRQFRLVTQLVESLPQSMPRAAAQLQGVSLLRLSRGGANTLAMRVNKVRKNSDTLVRMARAVKFRVNAPSRVLSLKISTKMEEHALDGFAAQFATLILVRAGRILAAKRLFRRTQGRLDPQVRTSLGNVILDGYIMRLSTRNGRHMRKVLAAYDFLVREGGFIPDRITVNTLLKAILRWRNMVDCKQLRALFDHLVRNGYPGGRHLSSHQVPFGTPLSFGQIFRFPRFDQPMSFERHMRPMLKMFIKAFHVRGDVAAARQVVGILKVEEGARMWKRDKWMWKSHAKWGRV